MRSGVVRWLTLFAVGLTLSAPGLAQDATVTPPTRPAEAPAAAKPPALPGLSVKNPPFLPGLSLKSRSASAKGGTAAAGGGTSATVNGKQTTLPKVELPPVTTAVKPIPYGQVYVLRGLLNVFSRGMDQIGVKLKERGVNVLVFNHSRWHDHADKAIARYKTDKSILPIIIVGHSLGADGAILMANYLGLHNVPVRLVIPFDGVIQPAPVAANVEEVVNYYKPDEWGQVVKTSPRFKGTITNIDLTQYTEINHLNVDKIEELQDEAVVKILDVLKKSKPKIANSG